MKFNTYITEAPIKIDKPKLKSRLENAFAHSNVDRTSLIDDLNSEFKKDRIYFEIVTTKPGNELIQGSIDKKTLKIYIEVGIARLAYDPTTSLITRTLEALEHELVHRQQQISSHGKMKTFIPPEEAYADEVDHDTISKYLADKGELMAYAIETVTVLKHDGYDNKDILAMVKSPEKWNDEIEQSRSFLAQYLIVFGSKSYQYKRLAKYIYQHISGGKNEV
jgi:hypothetical protein